jgi:hypothetical protein
LRELLDWLAQVTQGADAERVAIAMEVPRGAIIDALLERRYSVFSINPKQLDRFRDRFSVAGAKDDRRDARVLAHSVRTDRPHFRRPHSDDPRIVRIRELSRGEEALGQDLRRHANQLWSFLQRYFPAVLRLCPGADEPWAWALLRRCRALPSRAARLHPDTVRDLLRQHRIRRLSAQQVCETLRHPLPLAQGAEAALAEQVLLLLPQRLPSTVSPSRTHNHQHGKCVPDTRMVLCLIVVANRHRVQNYVWDHIGGVLHRRNARNADVPSAVQLVVGDRDAHPGVEFRGLRYGQEGIAVVSVFGKGALSMPRLFRRTVLPRTPRTLTPDGTNRLFSISYVPVPISKTSPGRNSPAALCSAAQSVPTTSAVPD